MIQTRKFSCIYLIYIRTETERDVLQVHSDPTKISAQCFRSIFDFQRFKDIPSLKLTVRTQKWMVGRCWKTTFRFGWPTVRGSVSFRERIKSIFHHLVGFLNLNDHDFASPGHFSKPITAKRSSSAKLKGKCYANGFCRAAELHISL